MKVTNVRVKVIENKNRLKAVATITFDDSFVVHELRLIEGKNGLFVAMPSKRNTVGEFRDLCHPITQELRQHVEEVVINAYHEALEESVEAETETTVDESTVPTGVEVEVANEMVN